MYTYNTCVNIFGNPHLSSILRRDIEFDADPSLDLAKLLLPLKPAASRAVGSRSGQLALCCMPATPQRTGRTSHSIVGFGQQGKLASGE